MATTIHTKSEFFRAYELGLTQVWEDNVGDIEQRTYTDWLMERPAEHFTDTDWAVAGFGVMPKKGIGSDIETGKILQGPTKVHSMATYGLAAIFEYEAYRWELYGIFDRVIPMMSESAVTRYNLVAYGFLNQGFSTTEGRYQTMQGEPLFSTSHTRFDGGTWSNSLTSGLSYTAMQDALILFGRLVNEQGIFITGLKPDKILVPTELGWVAETLLRSADRPGTADNDVNTVRNVVGKTHVSPYISSTTAWFLFGPKSKMRMGLRLGDDEIPAWDSDVKSRSRIFSTYCAFEAWCMDSRGAVGSTGGS